MFWNQPNLILYDTFHELEVKKNFDHYLISLLSIYYQALFYSMFLKFIQFFYQSALFLQSPLYKYIAYSLFYALQLQRSMKKEEQIEQDILSKNKESISQTKSVPNQIFSGFQKILKNKKPSPATVNILTKILDDAISEQQRKQNPQLIRVKNNLLLVLFFLSAYGLYYLIGDFIDILLTAFIAGIAYKQTQLRFTNFGTNESLAKRIIKSIILSIFAFTLPRIRYLLSHPKKIWKIRAIPSFKDFINQTKMESNQIIIFCQLIIIFYIIYLLLGSHLRKIGYKIKPTNQKLVKTAFFIISFILIILCIAIIPSILFKQVSSVGLLLQTQIQQKLGCQVISLSENNNSTSDALPYCSQKIVSQNIFIKQTIAQFMDQNKTIAQCVKFLKDSQKQYLQKRVFKYEQIICTWYTFIQKASTYSGLNKQIPPNPQDWLMTSTNLFKTFFGNLTLVITGISSFIFSATTFITMFYVTIQHFDPETALSQFFSQQKQQLVSSITNLIQATFLIVFEHYLVSILLLQIFNFTNINLIVSTILSSMAFFPFFRPWFGILIVAILRIIVINEKYISVIFLILYYFISQKIYSFHYRKMQTHQIITNMSVLFGIYQFGLAGIFYGPLLIIFYKCVERELIY